MSGGGGQQVARTCRGLAREAAGDVVWCTHFLRRFGLDFWGKAAGRHPYHVPPTFPRSARCVWCVWRPC
jgi:hypothetical protein